MSNVIKAAAITYTQEKRTIDSNGRAEQFTRLFVEKHAKVNEEAAEAAAEFEPGIPGIRAAGAETNAGTGTDAGAEPEEHAGSAPDEEALLRLQEQAEEVLANAREEVSRMLADAEKKAEDIKKKAQADAQAQGYREGERRAKAEYEERQRQLEQETQAAKDAYERQAQELEPVFAGLTVQLLKKLTGVLLEDRQEIVAYLLEQALTEIEPGMNYLIHVSGEDYELVNHKKSELLWKLKEGAVLEVTQDRTLQRGQCMIETESRIFDCSLDTQLKNLSLDLKLLAGGREPD